MTCPACATEQEIPALVSGIGICPACKRSVSVSGGRVAVAEDTVSLTDAERAILIKARKRPARG